MNVKKFLRKSPEICHKLIQMECLNYDDLVRPIQGTNVWFAAFRRFPFWLRAYFMNSYIHTYIIGHYNPSVRITAELLTPLMLRALNFIREWRDLQFNIDSERQIFEKLFHGRFIFTLKVLLKIRWEEVAEEIFFYFIFDDWPGMRI